MIDWFLFVLPWWVKVGAGLLDVNEVEEEVDLIEVYEREYPKLLPRLRTEVLEMVNAIDLVRAAKNKEIAA